jgi:hypothetical protein
MNNRSSCNYDLPVQPEISILTRGNVETLEHDVLFSTLVRVDSWYEYGDQMLQKVKEFYYIG